MQLTPSIKSGRDFGRTNPQLSLKHSKRVAVWLRGKNQVNELYNRWQQAGAKIVSKPEDKPWRLREFRVADLDDNQFRVFYDFSAGLPHEHA